MTAFLLSVVLLGLTACGKLNVMGDSSEKSFEEMLISMQSRIYSDDRFGGWTLMAPDGEARFVWTKDFSKTTTDVMLELDAQPFIDAGLNISMLPKEMLAGDKIIITADLGDERVSYMGEASPLDSYKKLVKKYKDSVACYTSLDHYGISLGDGNMFEWAKNMKTNDRDIIFVLNPKPFLDAGVNPAKLETWVYAKLETVDENGNKVEVDKILKPFDVES